MKDKDVKRIHAETIKKWHNWLLKNHLKEERVFLVTYKKHTGKSSISHKDAMEEAICFGWIDTIIRRIDEDKFERGFVKRKKNAGWSNNTLSYAKRLVSEGRMTKWGIEAYERALKKPTIDKEYAKNRKVPDDLNMELDNNKKAKENFEKVAPSYKKIAIYWIMDAKREETRKRRINEIVNLAKENKKKW